MRLVKQIYGPNSHAQDTWIFHSNCKIRKTKSFDFILGILGCDNILAYELVRQGIYVYNNPLLIKTWHLQKKIKEIIHFMIDFSSIFKNYTHYKHKNIL